MPSPSPSQLRSRTPDGSVYGRPEAWTRTPGAWPAMQMRAEGETWNTGRGSCERRAPYRGASRQTRQARMSAVSAGSEAQGRSMRAKYPGRAGRSIGCELGTTKERRDGHDGGGLVSVTQLPPAPLAPG